MWVFVSQSANALGDIGRALGKAAATSGGIGDWPTFICSWHIGHRFDLALIGSFFIPAG